MNKQREQLRMAEKELKDREEAFRQVPLTLFFPS
jgi:hypothetical protein